MPEEIKKPGGKRLHRRNIFKLGTFLLILILFLGVVFFVDPAEVVDRVGTENTYLILFIFAFFGGLSSLTAVPFYALLTTFFVGGVNPLLASLVVAPGLFFGNSSLYLFGNTLHDTFPDKIQRKLMRLHYLMEEKKISGLVPFFVYIYLAILPISPDALILFLSGTNYSYKKMILPMLLGEITFVILFGFSVRYGFELINLP